MDLPDKGTLLDILKGSAATLALFLACITLPLVGFLPGIFTPLPGMFYTVKRGKGAGLAVVLIAAAVLAAIADPMVLFLYLAQGGLFSLAIPYFMGKGWGAGRAITFSVAAVIVAILVLAASVWLVRGIDPHAEMLKGINANISQSAAFYEKLGYKGEELQTLQAAAKEAGLLIARLYPALVIVGLGIIAGLNLLVWDRMAGRLGRLPAVGDFRKYRNPDHLIWVPIAAGFTLLINNAGVSAVAQNVLVLTLSLYFLQGLTIVINVFDRFRVGRFIRVIFYVLLAMQPYLAIAIALFGVFDLWGNFRTPKKHENL